MISSFQLLDRIWIRMKYAYYMQVNVPKLINSFLYVFTHQQEIDIHICCICTIHVLYMKDILFRVPINGYFES